MLRPMEPADLVSNTTAAPADWSEEARRAFVSRMEAAGAMGSRKRFHIPLVSGTTEYISFVYVDESDVAAGCPPSGHGNIAGAAAQAKSESPHAKSQNTLSDPEKRRTLSRVLIRIECYQELKSLEPLFVIPLEEATMIPTVTANGACLTIMARNGVFEFQFSSYASRKRWTELMSLLSVRQVGIEEIYTNLVGIGRGTFARVFSARHVPTGQAVAIKAIPRRNGAIDDAAAELRGLRELAHPFIVALYAAHEDDSHVCLVLELLFGGEIYSWIRRNGPLVEAVAKVVMYRILLALAHMHAKGYVHRDLKAENLALKDPNDPTSVKIIDLGLAAKMDSDPMKLRCGSAGYVAPEVILGRTYGPKVDVFSAGVVLYITLCGVSPFASEDFGATMIQNFRAKPLFAEPEWKNVSPKCRELLSQMLQRSPEKRCTASDALRHSWFAPPVPLQVPPSAEERLRVLESLRARRRAMGPSARSFSHEKRTDYKSTDGEGRDRKICDGILCSVDGDSSSVDSTTSTVAEVLDPSRSSPRAIAPCECTEQASARVELERGQRCNRAQAIVILRAALASRLDQISSAEGEDCSSCDASSSETDQRVDFINSVGTERIYSASR